MDRDPVRCNLPTIRRAVVPDPPIQRRSKDYIPVSSNCLTELELWMLQLGSPGEDQLDFLPGKVTGIPPSFHYHPFWYIDWKEEAWVQKQAAGKSMEWMTDRCRQFYMDFEFTCALLSDHSKPSKTKDRVIDSWDGYSSYRWWWVRLHGTPGSFS